MPSPTPRLGARSWHALQLLTFAANAASSVKPGNRIAGQKQLKNKVLWSGGDGMRLDDQPRALEKLIERDDLWSDQVSAV
jgi:hypothetical protein